MTAAVRPKMKAVITKTTPTIAGRRKIKPAIVSLFLSTSRCSLRPPPQHAVVCRGRYEERRSNGGAKQRHVEDPGLQVVQIRETLGKRHHEEESDEHLHARQYHPKLVQ